MKIEIICTFYQDEYFAPIFMKHYAWADTIHALIDESTTDRTEEIINSFPNAMVEKFRFPDGMDDILKIDMLTEVYKESKADWVVILDSDEFLFTLPFDYGVRQVIEDTRVSDVVTAKMFQVYRHVDDVDVDPDAPIIFQRRHGDPNTQYGINSEYNKPIIIRTGKQVVVCPGHHFIHVTDFMIGGNNVYGAHWCNADPLITVPRRMRAMARQSQSNLQKGLSIQHHNLTEDKILEELRGHCYDPLLF
jgi:hypothetical protein